MCYFKNAKEGDVVFGLIFGEGVIEAVFDADSYYSLLVEFKNGSQVAYTDEGIPNWGAFEEQTLFYKDDICLEDIDFKPLDKVLSKKKIIKLRKKGKLEIRSFSGIWLDSSLVEDSYLQNILEKKQYHLLRKKEK